MKKAKTEHVLLAAAGACIGLFLIHNTVKNILKPKRPNPAIAGDTTGCCSK